MCVRMVCWLAAVCRARRSLIALAVAGVALLTACSARSVGLHASGDTTGSPSATAVGGGAAPSLPSAPASSAATTPPVEGSPSLAPPPFPEASPVAVAGWQPVTSPNWGGYTFPVSGVTGVRAQWTQPSATGRADATAPIWVGIGGWGQTDLIQAGTFASPANYGWFDAIWYELLPARPKSSPYTVVPGDKIAVSIVQLRPQQEKWQISVDDMSGGQTFTTIVHYDSAGAYPSFVVEDPINGPRPSSPSAPFPHWGAVSFSNMQIRIGDRWKPAASVYGYRVQMVRNGHTLAIAGPLDKASGFTARQGP